MDSHLTSEQMDFLSEKGVIGLICELGDADGARFSELEQELTITSSTLNKRLKRGNDLGFFGARAEISESGSVQTYRLGQTGGIVYAGMIMTGVRRRYFTIKKHREELDATMQRLEELLEAGHPMPSPDELTVADVEEMLPDETDM